MFTELRLYALHRALHLLEETNKKLQALIDQTEANFQAFNDRMSELMTSNRIARENMLQKNDSLVELNLDYGR